MHAAGVFTVGGSHWREVGGYPAGLPHTQPEGSGPESEKQGDLGRRTCTMLSTPYHYTKSVLWIFNYICCSIVPSNAVWLDSIALCCLSWPSWFSQEACDCVQISPRRTDQGTGGLFACLLEDTCTTVVQCQHMQHHWILHSVFPTAIFTHLTLHGVLPTC